MPFVVVEMWEGRTPEQKKQLAKDITEAFVKNNTRAEAVQIILRDVPKNCWSQGGVMASDK